MFLHLLCVLLLSRTASSDRQEFLGVDSHDLSGVIPKVIHHTFKEDLSKEGAKFPTLVWDVAYQSWHRHFPTPEYKHMFWVDADLKQCIQERFPDFVKEYESFKGNIEASDAGRYCILHKHGGIYGDLDYEVLKNFYKELPSGKVSLIESPHTENTTAAHQVQNALMASPAGHPLWEKVFTFMSEPGMHAWNAEHGTGPRMLSRVAGMYPKDVGILPCSRFQRLKAEQDCGDPEDFDVSAGIHWNSMSYWSGNSFGGLKQDGWRTKAFWKLHPEFKGRALHEPVI